MKADKIKLPIKYIFEGQFQHLMFLALLVPGSFFLAKPALGDGIWLGVVDQTWFTSAVILAIIHQIAGWFVFRFQLVFSLFTRLFGKHDLSVWSIIFFPMFLLRPLLAIAVGIADYGSLEKFRWGQVLVGILLLIPALYTIFSIGKYFGVARSLGGDHFRQVYREMPLVREGAFKFSSNAMYTFVFLIFWSIALFTHSRAALVLALFQHAYIWVHMYCTEDPDMRIIYGSKG